MDRRDFINRIFLVPLLLFIPLPEHEKKKKLCLCQKSNTISLNGTIYTEEAFKNAKYKSVPIVLSPNNDTYSIPFNKILGRADPLLVINGDLYIHVDKDIVSQYPDYKPALCSICDIPERKNGLIIINKINKIYKIILTKDHADKYTPCIGK